MDPQTTWDQLLAAFAEGDWDAVEEHANALQDWLHRGGFPPIVGPRDLGPDWSRALALAGCAFALETVQCQWSIPQAPA
jgi:hypothetical protein